MRGQTEAVASEEREAAQRKFNLVMLLAAGAVGVSVVVGLGKLYHDWQHYHVQRQRRREPWEID